MKICLGLAIFIIQTQNKLLWVSYTYLYVRHLFSDPFSHVEGSSLVFSFLTEGKLRVWKEISPRPTTSTLTELFNLCLLTLFVGTYCPNISTSRREELVRRKDGKADRSHITEDLEYRLRILDFLLQELLEFLRREGCNLTDLGKTTLPSEQERHQHEEKSVGGQPKPWAK